MLLLLLFLPLCLGVVDVHRRIDCHPEPFTEFDHKAECERRGCIHESVPGGSPHRTPSCYYPPSTGYTATVRAGDSYKLEKRGGVTNPYGLDISPLDVKVIKEGGTLQVSIGTSGRYTPPIGIPKASRQDSNDIEFKATQGDNGTFAFKIVRPSTGTSVWDTTIGGFMFADKYIQIASFLPSANIYGLGEHVHKNLKHNMSQYTTWPMWAHAQAPNSLSAESTWNLYGVQPFYMCVEEDGNAHGVLFLNSNGQEVTFGPAPHLVYRTIGGQLDLVFFAGPTPEMVVQSYNAFVGKPMLPAYWALGFQLCRYGYANLTDMQNAVARTQAAGVPLDITYADIDYMDTREDFTEGDGWKGFGEYADQLHNNGMHLILIFDPAIEADYGSSQRAINTNVSFIEWPRFDQVPNTVQGKYPMAKNTKIMLGNVWPSRNTAFPDFLDPTNKTTMWWSNEMMLFHDNLTAFDGIWIDMNEPESFKVGVYSNEAYPHNGRLNCLVSGPDAEFDVPPYMTQGVYESEAVLKYPCSKSMCHLGLTVRGTSNFYNTRSLYGWSESKATAKALRASTGKRGAVISRSTYTSSGRYAGHWLGDNTARWEDLQTSVIGVMEFNMFGIPYVGSDICGFLGKTNEELCLRWHQMGAFSPFSRNHNDKGQAPQDPAQWPSVANAAKIALTFRYQYLPYLYTLHYLASLEGHTVVRPLFFEFPTDKRTLDVSYQFMWGSAMMIAPALFPEITSVSAYFPVDRWYSLYPLTYGQQVQPGDNDVIAPNNSLTPVFVRGGFILPRQTPSTTTTLSRRNPFELLVTVAAQPFTPSTGVMYYDDGETAFDDISENEHFQFVYSFNYTATAATLTIQTFAKMKYTLPQVNIIDILGYNYYPNFSSFTLNNQKINVNVQLSSYNAFKKILLISTPNLIDMNAVAGRSATVLRWSHHA